MTNRPRDPHPDSPPRDDPFQAIEEATDTDGRERDAVVDDAQPEPRNGSVGGTDGVVKNQDDTAQ